MRGYSAVGKQRDHAAIEGWYVLWTAAADPVAIMHHFLIDPGAACIAYIVLNGVITGERAPFDQVSGCQ